ncbi:MAG: hypothetical protein KAQ96_04300, partial [Thermoplasmata archaeon]|nr:hypothetical protein [Thermoplasmata archaeon]
TKENGSRPRIETNGPIKQEERLAREVEVPQSKDKPKSKYSMDLDDLLSDLDIINGDDNDA